MRGFQPQEQRFADGGLVQRAMSLIGGRKKQLDDAVAAAEGRDPGRGAAGGQPQKPAPQPQPAPVVTTRDGKFDERRASSGIAKIAAERNRTPASRLYRAADFLCRVSVAVVVYAYVVTIVCQLQADRPSDAAGAARDQCDFAHTLPSISARRNASSEAASCTL